MKLFRLLALGAVALVATACSTTPQSTIADQSATVEEQPMAEVRGTLTYLQRIALPDDAVITVTLEDIAFADAPAEVISQDSFMAEGNQVPFNFTLEYDPNLINARHPYNIRARIDVDGQLMFTTDTIYPVITNSEETQQAHLILRMVDRSK
ncbi:hypothetical protein VST7929_01823 [Vibrio stylophorae]|uniref:Lipo-like protein n=1 Tax=Vibrio stylophorae TaxID=659351 RepID=A0ABM8ZUE3_9VIBR|nr:YbaY family lipoprotein [Vibrio stylophorae]CAH0533945.1 hypothetical protein VST7929_01823 [Vibrio stylophorae]